jgi:hypothetical protein
MSSNNSPLHHPHLHHGFALLNNNRHKFTLSVSCFTLILIAIVSLLSFFLLPLFYAPPRPAAKDPAGALLLIPQQIHEERVNRKPPPTASPSPSSRSSGSDGGRGAAESVREINGRLDQSPRCDASKGRWVAVAEDDEVQEAFNLPYYTNETCPYMQANQNCLSNGRPDRDYLRWRWKPLDCDLPRLDALSFLNLLRGKRMAFVGDSLARNQMQALLCALAKVNNAQLPLL